MNRDIYEYKWNYQKIKNKIVKYVQGVAFDLWNLQLCNQFLGEALNLRDVCFAVLDYDVQVKWACNIETFVMSVRPWRDACYNRLCDLICHFDIK